MNLNIDIDKYKKKPKSNLFSLEDDENLLMGFLGTNRTGKSSLARQTAEMWRKTYPDTKKHKIMSFDPQRRFQTISTDFIFGHDKDWVQKALKLRNALLILDDYRLLCKKARSSEDFDELMYMRAEYNIDIIYICHNPALVLNVLSYFTNFYYIFYTNTQEGGFKDKIPNYTLCEQASTFINDYVRYFGKGEYDKERNYPNFPHIMINCQKQELYARNVDTEAYKKKKLEIRTNQLKHTK